MDELCLRFELKACTEYVAPPFPAENTPVQTGVFSEHDMKILKGCISILKELLYKIIPCY